MEVSVGGRGGGWTRRLPRLVLLLLGLQLSTQVFGEVQVTNTTRLEQVRSFKNTTGDVCLRLLADPPDVKVALRMMVRSTATNKIFEGGNATVAPNLLMANAWGELLFQHVIEDYRHALVVEMNGNLLTFNKHKKMFYTSYSFEEVLLLVKGHVMLSECPPPEEPTTTAYADDYFTYTTYINSTLVTSSEMEAVKKRGGSSIWTLGNADVPLLIILLVFIVLLVVVLAVGVWWWRHKRNQKKDRNKKNMHTTTEYQPSGDDVENHYNYSKLASVPEDNQHVNLNMNTFHPSNSNNKQVKTTSTSSTNEGNTSNSFTNYTNNPSFTNSSTTQSDIAPNSPISQNRNPLYKPSNGNVDAIFDNLTNIANNTTNLAYKYPENQGTHNY